MSLTVNTNVLSLTAQNNLNQSQKSLNSAIERLSSGSKINSAKDDAAGQAIANRLTSQITGLKQASSNANDGISLAQTTEGALDQVNDNLQRVRQLTVQAANGTNSKSDLESIQKEIGQRLQEIDRVSDQTSFNGTKVLDGSKSSISIQVGSQDGETIAINLQNVDTASLKLDNLDVTKLATSVSAGGFTNNGGTTVASDDATFSVVTTGATDPGTFTNATVQQSGTDYYVTDDAGNTFAATVATPANTDTSTDGSLEDVVVTATGVALTDAAKSAAGLDPLADIDNAIKDVDTVRSGLGAVQNRLDSAITNISSTNVNLSSARSRIEDADYATEVSNLSKAQILQQAGTSVLAQANQTGQGVLSLLR